MDGYFADPPLDAHTSVAIACNKRWNEMSKDEQKYYRNQYAKRINQTIITGGGKNVLIEKYGVDPKEIDEVWNTYHRMMPEVSRIQKQMTHVMRHRGYIITLLGRHCKPRSPDKSFVGLNRALQGGNADIIKLKMVECDEYLRAENRPIDILNNVHDAVDYQFPEEHRRHLDECLRIMQSFGPDDVISLRLPMTVDGDEGRNWAEATYGTGVDYKSLFKAVEVPEPGEAPPVSRETSPAPEAPKPVASAPKRLARRASDIRKGIER
jgi:DNA polymerase I-like protein with 3'-5' exonuclease and polymerase domains